MVGILDRAFRDEWGGVLASLIEAAGRVRRRRHPARRREALLVNGGGLDGGSGAFLANAGEDLHAVGSLAPVIEGAIGCIVISPDGTRYIARVVADPLAWQRPD